MSLDKVTVLETGGLEIVCVVVGCGPLEWERGEYHRSAPDLQSELEQILTLTPLMEYNHPPTVETTLGSPPAHQDRKSRNLEQDPHPQDRSWVVDPWKTIDRVCVCILYIHYRLFRAYWFVGPWFGSVVGSEGGVSWSGVSVVVGCGLLRSGEGSGITIGCGGTSVVVGTSGEGAVAVGVELGSPPAVVSPSAGGTSVGCGSFKANWGCSVSEIGVSVKDQSPQHSPTRQRNSGLRSQRKNAAHHSVMAGRRA